MIIGCARSMWLEVFQTGDVIMKFREDGTKFYIIIKGDCQILVPKTEDDGNWKMETEVMTEGQYLHMMNSPEEATINIIRIKEKSKKKLPKWMKQYQIEQKEKYGEKYMERTQQIELGEFMKELVSSINSNPTLNSVKKEQIICYIRNPTREEYTINRMFEVNWIGDGKGVGDKALADEKKWNATVRAMAPTYCAVMSKESYIQHLKDNEKKNQEEKQAKMENFSTFKKSASSVRKDLLYSLKEWEIGNGYKLYEENHVDHKLYFLIEGKFEITKQVHEFKFPDEEKSKYNLSNPKEGFTYLIEFHYEGLEIPDEMKKNHMNFCLNNVALFRWPYELQSAISRYKDIIKPNKEQKYRSTSTKVLK